jgi:hypothetical protein
MWPLLLLVLAIAVYFAFLRNPPAEDLTADEVAGSWNTGIARLGISPVYPASEDFYVGDLWATIRRAEDADPDQKIASAKKDNNSTWLGKSVRLDYIDLRPVMIDANHKQPVFTDTSNYTNGQASNGETLVENDKRPDPNQIALTLAAFPGVTITRQAKINSSAGWSLASFGLSAGDKRTDEIRIPVAETYGVSAGAAFNMLADWCAKKETTYRCTDDYARHVMAFSISEQILKPNFQTRIQLQLVYRVFMTREIDESNEINGVRGVDLQSNVKSAADPHTAAPVQGKPDESPPAQPSEPGLGLKTTVSLADGHAIALHQVFQRPLVFGYRAVSIDLTPVKKDAK